MKYIILALICSFFIITPAMAADERTQVSLLKECEGKEPVGAGEIGQLACQEYLSGLHDMHAFLTDPKIKLSKRAYCTKGVSVKLEEIVKIYIKWASANSKSAKESARVAFVLAMSETYPCE